MKNFIETLKNIWRITELRNKILVTLAFLAVYRLGSYIPLPGIDASRLTADFASQDNGILGLLNAFTGGSFSQASILALGIMPYISASIVVQLMTFAVPSLQKLQKDGESGRKKISQITRYLTIIVAVLQGFSYIVYIQHAYGVNVLGIGQTFFYITSVIILVTGTVFTMWLGERITDRGVGNGTSLIIMVGILARLPIAGGQEYEAKITQALGGPVLLLIELVVWMLVIMLSVLIVQAVRKIPLQYAKAAAMGGSQRSLAGARQYIPIKLNSSGVMPIIFAQAIMFLPAYVGGIFSESVKTAMSDMFGFWYNIVFAVLIIAFTYLYTAIAVKTNDMADDMKRSGSFIPGIKPGHETANYIDKVLSLLTFPGSLMLAIIAVLPALAKVCDITDSFAMFYGGTSLLIIVGVILDTIQQVKSHLLNRHYDGLMKTGKIKQ